jgi:FlaA1/EpsC-like NDP-sugar epimerase
MKAVLAKVIELPRWQKRLVLFIFDAALLLFSVWLSYSLRLSEFFRPNSNQALLMVAAPLIAIPLLWWFGVYRVVVRYVTEKTVWAIANAMAISVLCWLGLAFMTELQGIAGVPRTIPLLFGIVGTSLIIGSRFVARGLLHAAIEEEVGKIRTIIYGAGTLGRKLAAALIADRRGKILAFLDNDPNLQGAEVAGARVHPTEKLPDLISAYDVEEIIVCADAAGAPERSDVLSKVAGTHIRVRFLAETNGGIGASLLSNIREIGIGDLLGRPVVNPDLELIHKSVTDKTLLVTGAGGSIGSELCRQIALLSPAKLVMLDQDETALYDIHRAVASGKSPPIIPVLASVTDAPALKRLFEEHRFDTVFHAAAYKHVPLVEANPLVAITNNVLGTWHLTQAARRANVERFVLISTDKAVRPTSIMGASKRWAEVIVRNPGAKKLPNGRTQRFCCVRFGNVVGSQGSVVPLFQEQIRKGGPITLTHEDMTRYFMSITEASELIIQAASLSEGGEVFLLDMGEPVRIKDLAETMIRLNGMSVRNAENPTGDIELIVVGPRPGEKLHEELFYDISTVAKTAHPKIRAGTRKHRDPRAVAKAIAELARLIEAGDVDSARVLLFSFIGKN